MPRAKHRKKAKPNRVKKLSHHRACQSDGLEWWCVVACPIRKERLDVL